MTIDVDLPFRHSVVTAMLYVLGYADESTISSKDAAWSYRYLEREVGQTSDGDLRFDETATLS